MNASANRHPGADANHPLSADEPLLDLEQLRALADLESEAGAFGYVAGLYELFAGDARQTLKRMRELLRCGDARSLMREAHRLKGSSGSIGAAGFSRSCREIEFCARMAGADLDRWIDNAQSQLDETVSALRDYVRQ